MPENFRVLSVCTGNICRSAQAEQLIRARLSKNFPALESVVVIESAGTGALVGSGMPAQAAALSAQYGGSPEDHSAQQLTAEQVLAADLILVMAAEHRRAVVRLLPQASRKTFILTEFAALIENAEQNFLEPLKDFDTLHTADKFRRVIKTISARRGYLSPEDASPKDVVDPYRRSDEVYCESASQIFEALDRAERAAVKLGRRVGA